MRIIYLNILIILLISSCKSTEKDLEMEVISQMYQNISKKMPPPPPQSEEYKTGSIKPSRIDYSKIQVKTLSFAINEGFIEPVLNKPIYKSFFKFNSKKIFERENLDTMEINMVARLTERKSTGLLDQKLLKSLSNENLQFLNHSVVNSAIREKFRIDCIVSFSNVSFNKSRDKASIVVSISRGKLNGSSTIYILKKINNKWYKTNYLTIEIS